MTRLHCDEVLERLPEWLAVQRKAGVEDDVRAHLDSCAACASEARMVRLLMEAGPATVPPELEVRLQEAVRAEFANGAGATAGAAPTVRRRRMPTWQLAAAAGAILAVATPVLMDRMQDRAGPAVEEADLAVAVADRLPSPWLDDEVDLVAGAPVLDGLTDDDLRLLLEEMGG